jgi:hypothetical protein
MELVGWLVGWLVLVLVLVGFSWVGLGWVGSVWFGWPGLVGLVVWLASKV